LIGAGDPGLFNVIDTTSAYEKGLFPSASLLDNLRVNVQVTVDRDMFVRSQDINVEIYTDGALRVSVNPRTKALVLDGVVLSDRGEYRFQGRRFEVKQGSATFVNLPDLNPTLQVTAEYQVQSPARETINIRIIIAGTLEDPRISLESDAQPPISQTDLLSYLAFGRTSSSLLQLAGNGLTSGGAGSSNLVGEGAALAARQVSAAALGALTDQLAGQTAKSIHADVLTISPADVSLDAGGFLKGTQVEFGKYVQARTFLGLQFRLDPASLIRPGLSLNTRLSEKKGYQINATFEPRYLPEQPTLSEDQTVSTTSVFGLFFVREWRY
jgi:translocation and assembly module TamB